MIIAVNTLITLHICLKMLLQSQIKNHAIFYLIFYIVSKWINFQ